MNKSGIAFSVLTSKIVEGDVASLRSCLLNKHCTVNEADENGQTLLMIAAQQGQVAIVNELLAHGADVNAEDLDNWSALTSAAKCGFKEVVIKLLDHGADIEHRDMGQWTPLMWASYKGHYYVVKILLEHSAMVNVVDKNQCTPLIWASGRGFLEIVEALLERGAKVYAGDKVDMGMESFDVVPEPFIVFLTKNCGPAECHVRLMNIIRRGLLAYEKGKNGYGYRLTTAGCNCLALRASVSTVAIASERN